MRMILCGPKGVGKTTLGQQLADIKRWPFFDLDELLKSYYNQNNQQENKVPALSIPEIFRALGEVGFRKLETQVLFALDLPELCVLATGGGAVLAEKNRVRLRQLGQVVYLDADKQLLTKRYLSGKKPAYIQADIQNERDVNAGLEEFLALCQQRQVYYQQAAHQCIKINCETVSLAIMQLERLGESCGQ
ncbi:shikimate kinase [Piscirickettsiaceae bacterium NZ-RLO2]|nr:shikimate kinase [Piscirickettsiaceae bacterium NZ-RLO2]